MSLLSDGERKTFLQELSPEDRRQLRWAWRDFWARPNQLPPPGDWRNWLLLAGRGFGKTRLAAEWVRGEIEAERAGRIALIAETAADARDVMVEGESGILAISPPWNRPKYEPSKRRLTWPNGAIATTYSGDDPEQVRGPQHDLGWIDELGKYRYATETIQNFQPGLRLGRYPRCAITTTPRPIAIIRKLLADPSTVITRGRTLDNYGNLPPSTIAYLERTYGGTRLGRQELDGELLEDHPGALWQRAWFEPRQSAPDLRRVVVAIDPAASSNDDSDETGIIVAGVGIDGRYYVLADRSCRLSPDGWARRAVAAFDEFKADRIVAEVNNGGEMVGATLKTVRPTIPYTAVHATRGKATRAEPIAALYEQGRVTHVAPFDELEDQQCTWTPESGKSPDRLDADVWALTELSTASGWGAW